MTMRFANLGLTELEWLGAKGCMGERTLDQTRQLDQFLTDVERRAFRIAEVSLRSADDALDVVQEAMIKLAQKYASRPAAEWRPLFFKILQNGIRDLQRRRAVRNRLFGWLPGAAPADSDEEAPDAMANVSDGAPDIPTRLMQNEAMVRLEQLLRQLPDRQREAFMLRNFEGLDVEQTALAMGCTAGSVKTHYSRAVHSLRDQLAEVW
jgi:RNA polymerase sigma-70 factor, ECF subfamily